VNGKALFQFGKDIEFLRPSYILSFRHYALNGTDKPIYYCHNNPTWSIAHLNHCLLDQLVEIPYDPIIIKDALQVYIDYEYKFFLYGHTSLYTKGKKGIVNSIQNVEKVFQFLKEQYILISPYGESSKTTFVVKPTQELLELRIISQIQQNIKQTFLIDCPFYNEHYIKKLMSWIRQDDIGLDKSIICSVNPCTTSFLKLTTGLNVFDIGDVTSKQLSPYFEKHSNINIILDRFHKISLRSLDGFLQVLTSLKSKHKTQITFYFIGDLQDFPIHSYRGGGDVFRAFRACVKNFTCEEWQFPKGRDSLSNAYQAITRKEGIQVDKLNIDTLKKYKFLFDYLKSIDVLDKKTKTKNDKGTRKRKKKDGKEEDEEESKNDSSIIQSISLKDYIIFVSSHDDKRQVIQQLECKLLSNHAYIHKDTSFFIGQKVHIKELDVYGRIDRAWKHDNNKKDEISGKTSINVDSARYTIEILGVNYNTKDYTISHADVMEISQYSGNPLSYVIFIIGKNTSRKHLACAVKYTLKQFKIFHLPNIHINEMKDDNTFAVNNALSNKLYLL
jgi:hypothetical protein